MMGLLDWQSQQFPDLIFTETSQEQLQELKNEGSYQKQFKAVNKALKFINNRELRHPSLNTHKYGDFKGPLGEQVFEAYAENNTPGAWRIFWFFGPEQGEITIYAITKHP